MLYRAHNTHTSLAPQQGDGLGRVQQRMKLESLSVQVSSTPRSSPGCFSGNFDFNFRHAISCTQYSHISCSPTRRWIGEGSASDETRVPYGQRVPSSADLPRVLFGKF